MWFVPLLWVLTPCFPDGPPLLAGDIYTKLEKHAWAAFDDAEAPPLRSTFGTCTVERNVIRDADGVVAELGCGVRILRRAILDDLGLEIGARGQDVLDRTPSPHPPLSCWGNGPGQTRCRFDRPDDSDTDSTSYVVDGDLPADALTGAAAEQFFAPRTIVEIDASMWCH